MAFEVNSLESATWAFKQIKKLEADSDEKTELARAEIEDAQKTIKQNNEWIEKETKSNNDSIDYFKSLLIAYYQRLYADNPKTRLSTPYGKVTSKKGTKNWSWDDDKTKEYLRLNKPKMLIEKTTFNHADAKKLFQLDDNNRVIDENGEVVDFVKVTDNERTFKVEVD